MIPKSYKIQDGCHNCAYSFEYYDYDDLYMFYCNISLDRPPCMSVAMKGTGEYPYDVFDLENEERGISKWQDWRDDKQVHEAGKCDEWKKLEKEKEV